MNLRPDGSALSPKILLRLVAALAVLVPLGFATKLYRGPGDIWVHAYAGALCYEVFWIFLLKAMFRRAPVVPLAVGVFLVTGALEWLQLSRHPVLEWIRSFFLGRALIGDGFDPWDFLYYGIGSAGAVGLYRSLIDPTGSGAVLLRKI